MILRQGGDYVNSRSNQRRKKTPMTIWMKVLIIVALFFVAGIGGYLFGGLPQNQKNMETIGSKTSNGNEQAQVKTIHLNESVKLSTGMKIRFTALNTYPQIDGPNCPIGVVAEIENQATKKRELPYKYLMNLKVNGKQASSVGIYSFSSVQAGTELIAYTDKLAPGGTAKVVYLFSMDNKHAWQQAHSGVLTMKDNGEEYQLTIPINHQQGEDSYVAPSSNQTTASTTEQASSAEEMSQESAAPIEDNQTEQSVATEPVQQSEQPVASDQNQINDGAPQDSGVGNDGFANDNQQIQ